MAAIYRTLLDEIERDGFRVLTQRTSLTPLRKLWIAWKTWITRVAIVGAGYAGMAAAVTLAERGMPVTVFESGAVPGGRARRVRISSTARNASSTTASTSWSAPTRSSSA